MYEKVAAGLIVLFSSISILLVLFVIVPQGSLHHFLIALTGVLGFVGWHSLSGAARLERVALGASNPKKPTGTTTTSGLKQRNELDYRSLAEGEIRLLRFCEDETGQVGPLHLELFHVKLSQRPQYVALSYSWGEHNGKGGITVIVNGRSCDVGLNLGEAIRKLKEHHITTFWCDAIGLNQQDTIEKSREIVRMFAIYRMASEVIIWLGSETGTAKEMAELVHVMDDMELPSSQQQHSMGLDYDLKALDRLLSQDYWSRVWVIQEMAAAKKAQLFWGSYVFELRSLETLLQERERTIRYTGSSRDLAHQVVSIRAATRAQQKPRLMDILAMTSSSSTSVLRDKVYGLLGLASDWQDFVQEPNYSQDVSEDSLSLEMTANHILWYSSADIIYLRSTHPHQQNLPSWCPDYFHFQLHDFDKSLVPYVCGRDVNLGWEKRRAFGQESPTMNAIIPNTFRVDGTKLTLRGRLIGRITALGSLLDEKPAFCHSNQILPIPNITEPDIGKAFRRLLLICHNRNFGFQGSSAFFSLLFALPDHVFLDRGCTKLKTWLDSHRAFFESFGVDMSPSSDEYGFNARRGGRLSPSSKLLPEWTEFFSANGDLTISRRGDHPVYSILRSIVSILEERMRLMFIGQQALLGWAHRDAELDDTVWQLEGCTLQAVLRKSEQLSKEHGEDIYTLVGHAYVDPVMASGRWMAKETRSKLVHLC